MDWSELLQELRVEKERLDRAIAAIESALLGSGGASPPKRRGRKGMSPEERRVVSERMTKYWAERRKQKRTEAR